MRNWIIIIASTLILTSWTFVELNEANPPAFKDIPVMKVNIYMMGRTEVEDEVTISIFENLEYLNETFEGQISFVFDELFMDPNHAYLPDIYKSFHSRATGIVEPIVEPIEKKGGINIYLFDTYCEQGQNAALMGFTPLLKSRQHSYATNSPRFDRILMAYDGLGDNKTLVHEMGHFFGLKHPWELTTFMKMKMGMFTNKDEAKNHMSYGHEVENFTQEQLNSMREYALNYRRYLMDRVVRVYNGA